MVRNNIKVAAIDTSKDKLIELKLLLNKVFPDAELLTFNSWENGIQISHAEKPDLFLLSFDMAGIDGCEVCTTLKSDELLRHIPVLLITSGNTTKENRKRALVAGADGFLSIPVDESELKALVNSMIRIKKSDENIRNEKAILEDIVNQRTIELTEELTERKRAEKKLIQTLDKINRNRKAIMNLMEDLKAEVGERKNIEENLQVERNLLRTLIDSLPDTIYIMDKECRKVVANKADVSYLGLKAEAEIIGKTDLELFPGETGKLFHANNLFVLKSGKPVIDLEENFIGKKGEERWLLTSQYPLYDSNGQVTGLLGTGHDITKRKKAEVELETKNKELQFLNRMSLELAQFPLKESIEQFLPRQLLQFSGAVMAVYLKYDKVKQVVVLKHIESSQSTLNKIIKVLGNKVLETESYISPENYQFIVNETFSISNSLAELSFGGIPDFVDKTIRKITGIDRFYALAIVVGGEFYGTTMLGFKKGTNAPGKETLISFARIAAISIQRRKAEIDLKESEFFFKESQRAASVGSYKTDFISGFWESSEVLDKIFGIDKTYSRSVSGWADLIHPDDKEMMNHYLGEDVINGNTPFNKEYRIIRKSDNEVRWVIGLGELGFDNDGNVISLIGTIQDITDRKRMEEKLIESEAFYRTLIDISPDGIFTSDMAGVVTYASIKTLEIFGIPPGEKVLGTSILSWVSPDYHQVVMERVTNIFEGYIAPGSREYKLLKNDKTVFWGELSSSHLIDLNGTPTGLLIVCRDISKRKKAEEELIRARDKAEESDRLKTAFLHNISHEIRTPMNAIIGFSALLSEPGLDSEDQKSFIETITRSSNHLLAIVSDIIEISNIEAGILKIYKNEFNLNPLLDKLYKQFNPNALEKGIEFRYETAFADTKDYIQTDSSKLSQILSNLLNNAFKFTTKGQISFGYNQKNDHLGFYISDTGIGIAEDQYSNIFERFYQVESSVSRQYEGTGLGLPISKAYVELLGGEIWLTSEKGKGSVFYFNIPFTQTGRSELSDKKVVKPEIAVINHKKTVLVAEDEETNYFLMVELLSSLNLNLIHARNGKEAVGICESDQQVDLVLMDIKMPVMDGYEATMIIKKLRPGLPVIAQTAYAFESDREKAINAGCDDYISKPFNRESLISVIKKHL